MNVLSIREELHLRSDTMYTDDRLQKIILESKDRLNNQVHQILQDLVCYEVSANLGDTRQMDFYKKRIIGWLGLV